MSSLRHHPSLVCQLQPKGHHHQHPDHHLQPSSRHDYHACREKRVSSPGVRIQHERQVGIHSLHLRHDSQPVSGSKYPSQHRIEASDKFSPTSVTQIQIKGNDRSNKRQPFSRGRTSPSFSWSSQYQPRSSPGVRIHRRTSLPSPQLECRFFTTSMTTTSCFRQESSSSCLLLPSVKISLKDLSGRIHSLLDRHGGFLPFSSLLDEYAIEFPDFPFDTTGTPSVHLDHLISCIRGIEVHSVSPGVKFIQWAQKTCLPFSSPSKKEQSNLPLLQQKDAIKVEGSCQENSRRLWNKDFFKRTSVSDLKQQDLLQCFAREVRGLLKSQPKSTISFSRFIPAYHTLFGKQCCVQTYGFSKLIDLLESIPHVVQVMGNNQLLTLTHKEQCKRFAGDLTRMLRSLDEEGDKKLFLHQIPVVFESLFGKTFSPDDYGVCFIQDLLQDVCCDGAAGDEGKGSHSQPSSSSFPSFNNNTVVCGGIESSSLTSFSPSSSLSLLKLYSNEGNIFVRLELPVRPQTSIEKARTRSFAKEVTELLKTTPNLTISFSKFIPLYHHFFRRQCRVSDYGFVKLIQLFQAISPSTVVIRKQHQVVNQSNKSTLPSSSLSLSKGCFGANETEDLIYLSPRLRNRILWDRVSFVMKSLEKQHDVKHPLSMTVVCEAYKKIYGHSLSSEDFSSAKLSILIGKQVITKTTTHSNKHTSYFDNNHRDSLTSTRRDCGTSRAIQVMSSNKYHIQVAPRKEYISSSITLKTNIPVLIESRNHVKTSVHSDQQPSCHSSHGQETDKNPSITCIRLENKNVAGKLSPAKLESSRIHSSRSIKCDRDGNGFCSPQETSLGFKTESESLQVRPRQVKQKEDPVEKKEEDKSPEQDNKRDDDQSEDQHDLIWKEMDIKKRIPLGQESKQVYQQKEEKQRELKMIEAETKTCVTELQGLHGKSKEEQGRGQCSLNPKFIKRRLAIHFEPSSPSS